MKPCTFCHKLVDELIELEQRWIRSDNKKLLKSRTVKICRDCLEIDIKKYPSGVIIR